MKRSMINRLLKEGEAFIAEQGFALPPFASWTPKDWESKGHECDEIRDNALGWDITDCGKGDFLHRGLQLVTIRNGNQHDPRYTKVYAEKVLVGRENQECGLHFHHVKTEDIINRGGGVLVMKLYNADDDNGLADTVVRVSCDGVVRELPAGAEIELLPGESVTLTRRLYHSFWAKTGHGMVLIGEVSQCNDDQADNYFYDGAGRFPIIEEDEAVYRYLCNEYPRG